MRLAIGIAGEKFAGKNEVGLLLENQLALRGYTTRCIGSGELIFERGLRPWNIPGTNRNRQIFAKMLVDGAWEGMGEKERQAIISNAMRAEMEASPQDVVVFNGLRWPPDIELIRGFPQNLILYVDASFETRRQRTGLRIEKEGEGRLMTEEEFRELTQRPTEAWIREIRKFSDYALVNEKTQAELGGLVRAVIEAAISPRLKTL